MTRLAPRLVGVVIVILVAAGCDTDGGTVASPPVASVAPATTVSPAVGQTRAELVRVLSGASLVLRDTQSPVRPAEAPLLASAPRAVFQVVLPDDPARGFIVVYEFSDSGRAAEAAAEEQQYLATGPGRRPDAGRHRLRASSGRLHGRALRLAARRRQGPGCP